MRTAIYAAPGAVSNNDAIIRPASLLFQHFHTMRRWPQRSCALAGLSRARWLPAVIVWLALLPSLAANAAAQHRFDSWTTENGLPQNSVNDILQTRDGYLWLATFGGLVRFDGVRFVIFDRSTPGDREPAYPCVAPGPAGHVVGRNRGRDADSVPGWTVRHLHEQGRIAARRRRQDRRRRRRLLVGDLGRQHDQVRWSALREPWGRNILRNRVAVPPVARYCDAWWTQDSNGLHVLVKGRVRTISVRSELNGAEINGVSVDRRGNLWMQYPRRRRHQGVGWPAPALHDARRLAEQCS